MDLPEMRFDLSCSFSINFKDRNLKTENFFKEKTD